MHPHITFPHLSGKRIQLGVSGSVAAYRAVDLLRHWVDSGIHVGVTLTEAASRFVTPMVFTALGGDPVVSRMFDHESHPFSHLEPSHLAAAYVIAPATANILAKMAHGLADDLLSCQLTAFSGPLVVAPAMNPKMWCNPATRHNWNVLKERGIIPVEPEEGGTACGDSGQGRLAVLERIHLALVKALSPQDLAGRRVLVSLGPTREPWDSVRFWTNPSSGKMGAAIAAAAWARGAEVAVVSGPVDIWLPPEIERHPVQTASQMYEACVSLWPEIDIACLTAAVCDFRPEPFTEGKFKKKDVPAQGLTIPFLSNPDILLHLGSTKREGQILVGFAAETQEDLATPAKDKLTAKNCDFLLANRVGDRESGFGVDTNRMLAVDRTGTKQEWPLMTKAEVAWRLWEWILRS